MPLPSSCQAALLENWQRSGFGLYIHWPFCASKCPYCDFNSHVSAEVDHERWKRAYLSEIARSSRETNGRVLSSVFFGGGTPSLMPPDLVGAILEGIAASWTLANDIEITLEANPSSADAGNFRGFRDAGINRVSIGIQALRDADLKALGRLHSAREALAAYSIARDVFPRASFDLIYARQNQSLDSWRSELRQALDLIPDHLSLYQLTIEDGTAFGDRYRRGRLPGLPGDDLGADFYLLTQEVCDAAGLPAYEISNHARPGEESRHNMIYWRTGDYVGIGPGAHGRLTVNNSRLATESASAPAEWLTAVERTGTGETLREAISDADNLAEWLIMGLRLREGIELARLPEEAASGSKMKYLFDMNLIETDERNLRATVKGRPLLNMILRELTADMC